MRRYSDRRRAYAAKYIAGVSDWLLSTTSASQSVLTVVLHVSGENKVRGERDIAIASPVTAGGGGKGKIRPGRHFPGGGISMKIENFRPVYGHLNALQLSISVHQRCNAQNFIFGRGSGVPRIFEWEGTRCRRRREWWVCTGGRMCPLTRKFFVFFG